MIKVRIKEDYIEVKGHANQNVHGTDIVCASVSTAIYMTINQIELFELKKNIKVEMNDGYTMITIIKQNDTINKIINNLKYTLHILEEDYSKYIQILK